MAREQPYLAAQIISKYGKRQVVSVENYTEISFALADRAGSLWASWSVIRQRLPGDRMKTRTLECSLHLRNRISSLLYFVLFWIFSFFIFGNIANIFFSETNFGTEILNLKEFWPSYIDCYNHSNCVNMQKQLCKNTQKSQVKIELINIFLRKLWHEGSNNKHGTSRNLESSFS